MLTALHQYSLVQWLLLFYAYCFFGWCFESTYVSLLQHRLVNRGFLRLPLLPIYGAGALCILLVCLPYQGNIPTVFVLGIIFPTILEYITGWAMEAMFKMRYWDYSNQKFQLNGHICLSSSIAWGFLSVLLIHVIHPPFARMILRISPFVGLLIVLPVTAAVLCDSVVAFRAAFNLRHLLEELERLHTQLDEARLQLELAKAEARDQLETIRLTQRTERLWREVEFRAHVLNKKYTIRALLRAHPTAMSRRFGRSLDNAREQAILFRKAMEEKRKD